MRKLVILGTGGNASDLLDIVDAVNGVSPTWTVAGFLDDVRPAGNRHLGVEILGRVAQASTLEALNDCWFVNSIGSDRSYRRRPEIVAATGVAPERFATLVHPLAMVSRRAQIGPGSYVVGGASIAGGVVIGSHVHLGACCIVGHDTQVDDYAVLAPGAVLSGFVHAGRACYVGTNACVRSSIHVGDGALVGMGAVVVRDTGPGETVVGNPATVLQRKAPPATV